MLMQGRGKVQLVLVIVLSDVLFFLVENSNKYSFFTPDNKVMYMCHVDHLYKYNTYRTQLFQCMAYI